MAFTRPWDDTQPPDTQLANLLGQDIRFLKQDIMQRMGGFGAGLLADRPTPDSGAGADFTGVMYWSTDTKQTFRWNGASWDDISNNITGGVIDYDSYTKISYASAAPGVNHTVVLPIGAVQDAAAVGSFIEIETVFSVTSSSGGALVYKIQIAGESFPLANFNVTPGIGIVRATLPLSNAAFPFASASYQNGGSIIAGSPMLLSTYVQQLSQNFDGSAAITITDAFSNATLMTGNAFSLHVRVRK